MSLLLPTCTFAVLAMSLLCCFVRLKRQHGRRVLLATVAQAAERHRLFYWVDFHTLHGLVHTGDAPGEHHTLGLLEDPRIGERWRAFTADLEGRGLQVRDRRVQYCAPFLGWNDASVDFVVYHADGDTYFSGRHGFVPDWMIGATRLHFWDAGACFLRLPAYEDMLLRWRASMESVHVSNPSLSL